MDVNWRVWRSEHAIVISGQAEFGSLPRCEKMAQDVWETLNHLLAVATPMLYRRCTYVI